ncbi:MAG: hypothetical protein RL204_633 [Bacteroidota bacterium]|jgi:hypothetical protein
MNLFRYRPLNDYTFNELKYGEIFFPNGRQLNDPLDINGFIRVHLENPIDKETFVKYLIEKESFFRTADTKSIFSKIEESDFSTYLEEFERGVKKVKSKYVFDLTALDFDLCSEVIRNNFSSDSAATLLFKEKIINALEIEVNAVFKRARVACFSMKHDNFLMWSHYAASHSGICIEYITKQIDENTHILEIGAENSKNNKERNFLKLSKVEYTPHRINSMFSEFDSLRNLNTDSLNVSENDTHELIEFYKGLFTNKIKFWKYEDEFRAVQLDFSEEEAPEANMLWVPKENIATIYVGASVSDKNKKRLSIIKTQFLPHVNLVQTKYDSNGKITVSEIFG